MKTRNDFVSNSSSSSFILQDVGFFKHFGITAADINQALFELYYGSKTDYDKQLAKELKHCDDEIAKAREANADLDGNYYVQRKNELLANGLKAFVVLDMTDPVQREKCYKEWDEHFSWWIAPNEGDIKEWDKFEDIVSYKCGFDNIMKVINEEDPELISTVYDKKTDTFTDIPFAGGAAFVKRVKDALEVKTMKEVLHDEKTTLMIHFDDNEVYGLDGMTDKGKTDVRDYNSDEENAKCRESKWESGMYSRDRFFEILIKYFITKGKINLADPELLDYWLVPDDHWWKTDPRSKYKDKKYFTDSDETATWQEVVKDMLFDNTILHEG